MTGDRFVIEMIELKDLLAFVDSQQKQDGPGAVSPIPRIRAEAIVGNPCACAGDVVLLVALANNRVIGYLGLFPGLLIENDGIARVYWMSTVYVADAFRGKGVGRAFLDSILSLGKDLVVTRVTIGAERMLKSCGFQNIGELAYFQLRLERLLLPSFEDFADEIGGFPDSTIVELNKTERYQELKRQCYRMWIESMPGLSETASCRMVPRITYRTGKDFNGSPCFYRSIDAINWMLSNPWVASKDEARTDPGGAARYYFTKEREIFKYFAFEFCDKGKNESSGYLVLSVSGTGRETTMKILDHAMESAAAGFQAVSISLNVAKHYLADRIDISSDLFDLFPHRNFPGLVKTQTRSYFAHPGSAGSPLARSVGRLRFQYFDGDTPFT